MSNFFKLFLFVFCVAFSKDVLAGRSELLKEFHASGFVHIKPEDVQPMKGSGSNTSAIYRVSGLHQDDPTDLVCKELKGTKDERRHLENLQSFVALYQELKKQRGAEFPPSLATIASYKGFIKGKEGEFVFFCKASGQSVFDIMVEWTKRGYGWCGMNPQESKYKLSYAFQNIGRAIANFHLMHGTYNETEGAFKTVTHGDLHASNIFYDLWSNETTFIDYETMVGSCKEPRDVFIDIIRLFDFSRTEVGKFVEEAVGSDFIKTLNVCFLDEHQGASRKRFIAQKLQILDEFFSSLKVGYEEAFRMASYEIDFNKLRIRKNDTATKVDLPF